MGQVGVVSSWYRDGVWALTDAELFFPESWFTQEKIPEWRRLHIPEDRAFARKLDLAKQQIDHAIENGERQRQAPPRGTSALRLAVENGHYEVAVALLDAGADR